MPHVELSDDLYERARQRAADAGYPNVDAYVADTVRTYLREADDDFDHYFTPELIAHLDKISAEMRAGNSLTSEEVEEHLKRVREEWLRNHPE